MHLICPPRFCINIVFNSSWDGCNTHEKWKTKVVQNLGGQIRCIMGNVEVAFARDELCLRLGGEIFSSKGPGLDCGIREIFACGIQNPGLWNPEYSSKKKFTLKSWIQMQAPLTKNLGSRIHGVDSKNQDCLGFLYRVRDQWRIRGRGPGGPAPLIFRRNWGPKGRKKNFRLPPPPLSQDLDDRAPLLWRSVSASGDFSNQRSVLNLVNFEMFNSL